MLSTGAVARACGVTPDGVLHWIHAGKLPAFRTPGGHFRVRREDLAAFLRASGCGYGPRTGGAAPYILVVDDERSFRVLLGELLRQAGYEVSVAGAAEEAREAIAQRRPDLVITDIMMPSKGGLELIPEIRQESLEVKIIAMSALGYDALPKAIELGADHTFELPFDPRELVAVVGELVGE